MRVLVDGRKLRRSVPGHLRDGRLRRQTSRACCRMAFAPDYPRSGRFYVYYTDHARQHSRRSSSAARRATANAADPASAQTVIRSSIITSTPTTTAASSSSARTGISTSGSATAAARATPQGNGQNLRIAARQAAADRPRSQTADTRSRLTNPFVGRPGARPEIWAYGLRNPWRFSFDRLTEAAHHRRRRPGPAGGGRLRASEGTGAGANYGWSVFEGDRRNKPGRAPHAVAPCPGRAEHSDGYCALIGGYVVRDPALRASTGATCTATSANPRSRPPS